MSVVKTSDKMTVELITHNASDEMVLHAARVSTTNQHGSAIGWDARDNGLIRYLQENKHLSPFEHNSVTMFVHAPVFVIREWQRHRTQSFSEESMRYKKLEPLFYLPNAARPLIQTGKVGHYQFNPGPEEMYQSVVHNLTSSYRQSYMAYDRLIQEGVAKEVARNALPVSIYSSIYVTANLRNWINFLELRTEEYAQHEIRDCAGQVEQILTLLCPRTLIAWRDSQ